MGLISAQTLRTCLRLNVSSYGLISLAEEISKQPDIDSVERLLGITLRQVYSDKRENRAERKTKVQIGKKKKTLASSMLQPWHVLQRSL